MCAALTIPIIKEGYRLYPGMPVDGRGQKPPKAPNSQSNLRISRGRMSPSESSTGSPNRITSGNLRPQPQQSSRSRTTSNQSQISVHSSHEIGPSNQAGPSVVRARSALSTSQVYLQQRRELAVQQLRKQELIRKQQQQKEIDQKSTKIRKSTSAHPAFIQQSDSNGNGEYENENCRRLVRSASTGDQNNNKESSGSNPFRKLLKRLGFGNDNRTRVSSPIPIDNQAQSNSTNITVSL